MTQIKKTVFHALMVEDTPGGEPVELVVTGLLVDQTLAMSELRKRKLTVTEDPITFLYASAWAALARTEQVNLKFAEFLKACYQVTEEKDAPPVDPTQQGPSSDSA